MLLSIITPTFNAGKTLRETLESVVSQIGDGVEHLLVDAVSSDETLAIAAEFPHLRITSERDGGIYDGMNKGARLARGEWLLFLQADDWLPRGTLEAYRHAIIVHPDAQMICGAAEAVRREGDRWVPVWSVSGRTARTLSVANIALGEPMINARLIRRDVFLELGGFSLEYTLASDRDFLLRAAESGLPHAEIDAATYRYRWHAGSTTMNEGNSLSGRLFSENLQIAKRHLGIVSQDDRKPLRTWHTLLRVQGAMNALESAQARVFLDHIASGTMSDPLWLLTLLGEIVRSLPGFLARGGRTRSRILCSKSGSFE